MIGISQFKDSCFPCISNILPFEGDDYDDDHDDNYLIIFWVIICSNEIGLPWDYGGKFTSQVVEMAKASRLCHFILCLVQRQEM